MYFPILFELHQSQDYFDGRVASCEKVKTPVTVLTQPDNVIVNQVHKSIVNQKKEVKRISKER